MAILSGGRFTLGVGAGERLDEHITGEPFPSVGVRHEVFREALEIINLLWQGGYQSYRGQHLQLDAARVFELPDTPITLVVAAGGTQAATIAAELGGGLFATEPRADLVEAFASVGGQGPKYAEAPLASAPSVDAAVDAVLENSRWAVTGWKVMSELPHPVNVAAASATARAEDIREQFACGPDVEDHVAVVQQFVDADFDHLVLMNAGPDPEGFLGIFTDEFELRVRALTSST